MGCEESESRAAKQSFAKCPGNGSALLRAGPAAKFINDDQ